MNGIKWVQRGTKQFPYSSVKIGDIELHCHSSKNEYRSSVYFGNKWIADTCIRRSSDLAQKDAEILAIRYLLGHSFILLQTLKKIGLLEDMLSEVGVDL